MKNCGDFCHMYGASSTFQEILSNIAVTRLAASLTSFLLAISSSSEGPPLLSNVTVVPYFSFHLLIIVFTVFHGTSNPLKKIFVTLS